MADTCDLMYGVRTRISHQAHSCPPIHPFLPTYPSDEDATHATDADYPERDEARQSFSGEFVRPPRQSRLSFLLQVVGVQGQKPCPQAVKLPHVPGNWRKQNKTKQNHHETTKQQNQTQQAHTIVRSVVSKVYTCGWTTKKYKKSHWVGTYYIISASSQCTGTETMFKGRKPPTFASSY